LNNYATIEKGENSVRFIKTIQSPKQWEPRVKNKKGVPRKTLGKGRERYEGQENARRQKGGVRKQDGRNDLFYFQQFLVPWRKKRGWGAVE